MKNKIFLSICILFPLFSYTQPVNYTVNVTQVQWFSGGVVGACNETGSEEYSSLVSFNDDVNGTNTPTTCITCDNNGNCTNNMDFEIGTRNNTCAQTVNLVFNAWEDDRGGRCSYDINGGIFDNDDDCGCGPSTVASINFQNSGPGCTTYGPFGCNTSNHSFTAEICWDFANPGIVTSDECAGAIAVSAGSTNFDTTCATGVDESSCAFNDTNDIWYSYTNNSTCQISNLEVNTFGSGFDTSLSAFDACGGNELACNDDSGGLQSQLNFTCIQPGETIIIRVSGFNGATGTGVLNVIETPDAESPMITSCPTQADIPADMNCMAEIPDFTSMVTATDNCDDVVAITQTPAAGTLVGIGAQSVTITATDDCLNSTSSCVVNFTVVDDEGPNCVAQNITVNIDATGNASVTASQINNGSMDNCGITSTTISAGQTAFTCDNVGSSVMVTLQVMDAAGNTNTCDATVIVADPGSNCCDAPMAVCQDITVQLDATGNISIVSADVDNGSTADCGLQSIEIDNMDFTCDNIGVNDVILTITDINDESDMCTAVVTVEDNSAPDPPMPPANMMVQCPTDVPSSVELTAIDNCDGDITVSPTEANTPGSCPTSFTIVRTWTFTDDSGNTSQVTQTIMVNDDTPPMAPTPPPTVTVQCAADVPLPVDLTATDNCDGDITISPAEVTTPGNCPNSFTVVRTWTFTDECLNESQVTQTITVNDDTPPMATCQDVMVALDVMGQATFTAADVNNGSSDNCTADPIISLDVNTVMNCTSSTPVTLTVTDECMNSSTCDAMVTVVDNLPPNMVCQNVEITIDATQSNEIIDPMDIDNGSTDNCGIVSLMLSQTEFSCDDNGTTMVTLTGTDAAGNSSSCTATVTVNLICAADAGRF